MSHRCELSGKSSRELAEYASTHPEERAHAAQHHVSKSHMLRSDMAKFFAGQPNTEPLMRVSSDFLKRTFAEWVAEDASLHASPTRGYDVMMAAFSLGAAFGMYIQSDGDHCLWGMIDPELCKEDLT